MCEFHLSNSTIMGNGMITIIKFQSILNLAVSVPNKYPNIFLALTSLFKGLLFRAYFLDSGM